MLFNNISGFLSDSVGNNYTNEEEDILKTRKNISKLVPEYDEDNDIPFITGRLDKAIKSFQKGNSLKIDGKMKPAGETERKMFEKLENKPSKIVFGEQYSDQRIGFGTGRATFDEKPTKKPTEQSKTPQFKGTKVRIGDMLDVKSENNSKKREEVILKDKLAKFDIKDGKSKTKGSPFYEIPGLGHSSVKKHEKNIEKYSKKHNVDPDLVKSIMYAENALGHKYGLNSLGDKTKISDTIMPMNINKDLWSKLIDKKPEDMYNDDNNIEAATILIKRISDRIENPTPEKIGSIWQFLGREKTNDFGGYIGNTYKDKKWLKKQNN